MLISVVLRERSESKDLHMADLSVNRAIMNVSCLLMEILLCFNTVCWLAQDDGDLATFSFVSILFALFHPVLFYLFISNDFICKFVTIPQAQDQ